MKVDRCEKNIEKDLQEDDRFWLLQCSSFSSSRLTLKLKQKIDTRILHDWVYRYTSFELSYF